MLHSLWLPTVQYHNCNNTPRTTSKLQVNPVYMSTCVCLRVICFPRDVLLYKERPLRPLVQWLNKALVRRVVMPHEVWRHLAMHPPGEGDVAEKGEGGPASRDGREKEKKANHMESNLISCRGSAAFRCQLDRLDTSCWWPAIGPHSPGGKDACRAISCRTEGQRHMGSVWILTGTPGRYNYTLVKNFVNHRELILSYQACRDYFCWVIVPTRLSDSRGPICRKLTLFFIPGCSSYSLKFSSQHGLKHMCNSMSSVLQEDHCLDEILTVVLWN